MQLDRIIEEVDADKTETGITYFHDPQPGQANGEIAHGMIVGSSVYSVNITHRLAHRLAKTDADGDRLMRGGHSGHDLEASLQFFPEIKQDGGVLPGTREFADGTVCQIGLPVAGKKQMVCTLY